MAPSPVGNRGPESEPPPGVGEGAPSPSAKGEVLELLEQAPRASAEARPRVAVRREGRDENERVLLIPPAWPALERARKGL